MTFRDERARFTEWIISDPAEAKRLMRYAATYARVWDAADERGQNKRWRVVTKMNRLAIECGCELLPGKAGRMLLRKPNGAQIQIPVKVDKT